MANKTCNVLLIHPRFVPGSFWNYQATCEIIDAKYPAPPLGLITIAAMLPEGWAPRLVDCNIEDLDEAAIEWADMVMMGAMLPQQPHALDLIQDFATRGLPVVVGGPDVTSSPRLYAGAAFRVLGEAEGIFDAFIAAWERGDRTGTFEAPKFQADVTTTPVPRFDLLDFSKYTQVSVQYSRGCPFTCEFCDIIEIYGRRPRTKTSQQILNELQVLYDLGYRGHLDFVDDNLIGNKKAVKAFLPELIKWQKQRGYPFILSTEASLNLADDPELLKLMTEACFFTVFIGIESPDPDVLNATRKKQNTRRDIAASVHKIYAAGIFVIAGFIVGFDEESGNVAEGIIDLIEEAAIPVAMAGLLYALPNTQLTRRLTAEGRLHEEHDVATHDGYGDQCTSGLNFESGRPRIDILTDFRAVVSAVYSPQAYFGRVRRLIDMIDLSGPNGQISRARLGRDLKDLTKILWRVTFRHPDYRREMWSLIGYCLRHNPAALNPALILFALYLHLGPFSTYVTGQIDKRIEEERAGTWNRIAMVAAQ